ncbi:putative ribonuclease H-like domain-containing protein [Tanacetum coccineum]
MPSSTILTLMIQQFTYGSKSNNYAETNSFKSSSSKTNDPYPSTPSSVDFKTMTETAAQQPSSTNDDSSFSFKENVKPLRHLYGELLLSPQQVVLGEFKSQICNGDPRIMENPHKNRDLRIVDSGCSRSMTGNKEKLDDFVKIVGGTVTFGGRDGKITGKGTIRTSKLNFENVYYVEELQNFNLFSEFPTTELSQVVVRIPRRHNLYCFNLSNIQPERDVTCLLAKASLEESTKWHRRMAHVNFKNIEQLLRIDSLWDPSNSFFTNEHNCVACNKGKQHKASYKAITAVSTISAPLQLLHMDLFGPTSIRSIDHKYYSLVVTDDFSSAWESPNIIILNLLGCLVTIITPVTTRKICWGKADEGFIVGMLHIGLGHEWYFDLDYLTDSLGYTRFKTTHPAGAQDTNIHAGSQDDLDSECDEQVIVVPSFPSNSFSGTKVNKASEMMESSSDYAEELARLQKQAYEANSIAEQHLSQADLATSRNGVPAGKVVPAADVSAGHSQTSTPVCTPVHTAAPSFPPGHSLGSSAHSTRYPSPSDLANSMSSFSEMEDIYHHPDIGIFSSSSYDDDFGGTVTNLAPSVVVDSVPTKRVNTIHPQSQILGDLTSPVQTREGKFAIGTKWILKNKRDARGIVVRNKARLVAQGHRQKEGIDYNEVYVDDIIFGSTNQAWCDEFEVLMKGEFEMSAMGELTFFLGLQVKQNPDGIFISQDKYVQDMLKKFDMENVRSATTPFEASKPKSKDEPDDASRRSFKYLERPTKNRSMDQEFSLSVWKHTVICKKQTIVATSSTEAEYVAAASCCGQCGLPKKTIEESDIILMIHIHSGWLSVCLLVREFLLVALNVSTGRTVPAGFVILINHDPIIYDSLVKQFWSTASLGTFEEGPPAIIATIDRTPYTITESLVRSQLQLDDEGGVEDLPSADIYLGMDNMGYPTEGKLTFHKNKFSPQWRFIVHTIMHCLSTKSGSWDQFGSSLATALICLTEGRKFNWSSYIFKGMVNNITNPKKFLMFPRFLQMILNIETRNSKQYHAFKLTSKMFANTRLNFHGNTMPLLATMLPPALPAIAGDSSREAEPTIPHTTHPCAVTRKPTHPAGGCRYGRGDGGGCRGDEDDADEDGDEVVMRMMYRDDGGGGSGWRWWRVAESGYGDRVDPVVRTTFGFDRKSPPENFFGGGGVAAVAAGGGGGLTGN